MPVHNPVTFVELVTEAESASVEGWDFSWLNGRATEERPSWGYARMLEPRISAAGAVLDIQTGGGEVLADALARVSCRPVVLAATESWPPNTAIARRNLDAFGVRVIEAKDEAELPFPDASFDLVVSRHPTIVVWPEIARVLGQGGKYFSQQVGDGTNRELTDFMMGPQAVGQARSPDRAVQAAQAAGLRVIDLREETLRVVFDDVGAVVYFLRKVFWTVPDFTVDGYRERLVRLHDQISSEGPFVSHARRFLIEAEKPC